MNTPDHLLIRADASSQIGTGHVMRMIALAQAYQDRGGRVIMACASCPESIAGRVRRENINCELVGDITPGSTVDLQQTLTRAKSLGTKWVVLDGYHFDIGYQRALREAGFRVLAVDDYGHCDIWAADAVLNQNIFAPELKCQSEVKDCRFLLGTRFALLRREFREEAERRRATPNAAIPQATSSPIRRLLVTLGGADPDNATGRVLTMLNSLVKPQLEIKAVVGGNNPHWENLRQLASSSPHSIEVLQNVVDMPALYRWAEGVISAGGSTCWEWLFYQLPAAVVCLANNQRPVIAGLVNHGLALDLGWHTNLEPSVITQKLQDWLNSASSPTFIRKDLNVDGLGADRVASVVDESGLWIRRVTSADCRLYFDWANDTEVRANALQSNPIAWETHVKWFEQKLQAKTSLLYVVSNLEDIPIGQVRLDQTMDGRWEVDLSVAKERRFQGIGLRMLKLVLNVFRRTCCQPISACVRNQNMPSIRVFEALGFQRLQDCPDGLTRFIFVP